MTPRQRKRACSIQAVASVENLFLAAGQARRGKSTRPDVEAWWMIHEREIATLREELLSGAYAPAGYRFFEIREPKRRLIAAAPFRDRVVHHALCNVIAPVLIRRFIARSFSCQIGKGTMAARECCRKLVNQHQYVLKCDVSKFFPNIDQRILFEKLSSKISDEAVLGLIWKILCSYRSGPEVPVRLFPDDDLVEAAARPRGPPPSHQPDLRTQIPSPRHNEQGVKKMVP